MQLTLLVNGRSHTLEVDPATPLLFVLSDDLALKGPKFGCGLGQCGACTVIIGGQAIRSCITPVEAAQNTEITTLDGLGSIDRPHPIQQAFIDEQATQCGFCLSGVILGAKALVDRTPAPTDDDIDRALGRAVPLLRAQPHAPRHPPLRGVEARDSASTFAIGASARPQAHHGARRALGDAGLARRRSCSSRAR